MQVQSGSFGGRYNVRSAISHIGHFVNTAPHKTVHCIMEDGMKIGHMGTRMTVQLETNTTANIRDPTQH